MLITSNTIMICNLKKKTEQVLNLTTQDKSDNDEYLRNVKMNLTKKCEE